MTLVSFMIGSLLLAVIMWLYEPPPPYDQDDYQALERLFRKRSQILKEEESQIRARYEGKTTVRSMSKRTDIEEVKVNINKAGLDALQTLPGIGPALAERILAYRKRQGPFERVDELVRVKGIGRITLQKMRGNLVQELRD